MSLRSRQGSSTARIALCCTYRPGRTGAASSNASPGHCGVVADSPGTCSRSTHVAARLDGEHQNNPVPHVNRSDVADNRIDIALDDGGVSSLWWVTPDRAWPQLPSDALRVTDGTLGGAVSGQLDALAAIGTFGTRPIRLGGECLGTLPSQSAGRRSLPPSDSPAC